MLFEQTDFESSHRHDRAYYFGVFGKNQVPALFCLPPGLKISQLVWRSDAPIFKV